MVWAFDVHQLHRHQSVPCCKPRRHREGTSVDWVVGEVIRFEHAADSILEAPDAKYDACVDRVMRKDGCGLP